MSDTPFSNLMMTRMKLREPAKYKLTSEDVREMSKSAMPKNIEIALYGRFEEGE